MHNWALRPLVLRSVAQTGLRLWRDRELSSARACVAATAEERCRGFRDAAEKEDSLDERSRARSNVACMRLSARSEFEAAATLRFAPIAPAGVEAHASHTDMWTALTPTPGFARAESHRMSFEFDSADIRASPSRRDEAERQSQSEMRGLEKLALDRSRRSPDPLSDSLTTTTHDITANLDDQQRAHLA